MDITRAFADLQEAADADPNQVSEGRRRRDLFRDAFCPQAEINDVVPSGSLARSTQRDPINDVDVIVIYESHAHSDWGTEGDSADEALKHTAGRVNALLGATSGSFAQEVRLARRGNHAVKCFFDDPDDEDAFTVDAMPALRQDDGTLLVPERESRKWIATDPEHLIELVRKRQEEWDLFRPLVRVLKLWKDVRDTSLKSLTVEVLALHHLPSDQAAPQALYRFFTAAEQAIEMPIEDPAGLCGPTQPEIDLSKARSAIQAAARASWEAVTAQDDGDTNRAACQWRQVFGDAFPEPPDGCAQPEPTNGGGALGAGLGIGVGGHGPRPVKDAPQG
jgi:hypothetical protein